MQEVFEIWKDIQGYEWHYQWKYAESEEVHEKCI